PSPATARRSTRRSPAAPPRGGASSPTAWASSSASAEPPLARRLCRRNRFAGEGAAGHRWGGSGGAAPLPRRSLDDAVLPEPRDLVGRVVQLAQDLVRVLAVRRRGAADRTGRAGVGGRECLEPNLDALGMAHVLGHPRVLPL